jgi:hypothetical protein
MALNDPRDTSPSRRQPASSAQNTDAARLVGDERLPCGRLVSHVWQQARDADGQDDPHAADCEFCQQAVEGLTALDNATNALRAQRLDAHTVATQVINAVRAETRLGRMLPLDDPERELRIAETTAAKVLRRAADRVHGVRAASCRLTPDDNSTRVAITMTLAMTLDDPLPDRAAEVRRAVAYAARQQLGLATSAIDLHIMSVLEPFKPTAPAESTPQSGRRQ